MSKAPVKASELTDSEAREIAGNWWSGELSALWTFAGCGQIRDDLLAEIEHEPAYLDGSSYQLYTLRNYVSANGVRGPVSGWANLTLS